MYVRLEEFVQSGGQPPLDPEGPRFARTRARACKYARKCRVSSGEGCPTSLSFRGLFSRPPPRFSPYGPHRSSHALSPLPRIPPVITPLLRRATKMAAPPVHPTVRLSHPLLRPLLARLMTASSPSYPYRYYHSSHGEQ